MIVQYNPREVTAVVRFLRKVTQSKMDSGQTMVADIFRPDVSEAVAVASVVRDIMASAADLKGTWESIDTGGYSVLLFKGDGIIIARVFIELYIAGFSLDDTSFEGVPYEANVEL